jgi:hypothetical protein
MAEQRRFEVGDVAVVRKQGEGLCLNAGERYTVTEVTERYGCEHISFFHEDYPNEFWQATRFEPADTSPTADPVVALPECPKCRNCSWVNESERCMLCGVTSEQLARERPELLPAAKEWADAQQDPNLAAKQMRECGWTCPPRVWDADKYNGLADWTPLDQRIAAVKAEHTRQADSSGLLHPLAHWSGRNSGRRAR